MKCVYFHLEGKPGTNVLDERITLAMPLKVEGYGCGLFEISGRVVNKNQKRDPLYLCCDICEDSNVHDNKMPVLRQLVRNGNGLIQNDINHIIWLKINRPIVSTIRLYIATADGELASLTSSKLDCALLFIPRK